MNGILFEKLAELPHDIRETIEINVDSYLYETIHKPNHRSCIDHLKQYLLWADPESVFHPRKVYCKKIAALLLLTDEKHVTENKIIGNLLNYLVRRSLLISKGFTSVAVLDNELRSLAKTNLEYLSVSDLAKRLVVECTRPSASKRSLSVALRNNGSSLGGS
jgi:hypothetical protein